MDADLQSRILKYVNAESPLGPADAHLIKDPEVAARLFDPHNASFNSLLRKEISVVIGRRGSGKTALLNSYLYKPYFAPSILPQAFSTGLDLDDYNIVLPAVPNKLFEHINSKVYGATGTVRSIESVVEEWETIVHDFVIATLLASHRPEQDGDEDASVLSRYLSAPETQKRTEAYSLVWGQGIWERITRAVWRGVPEPVPTQQEAVEACSRYLSKRKARAVIIFDSMDEYQVGDTGVDRTVGALLRFVGQFNLHNDRMRLKLGLPSEIFPEIQRASANPLKDFVKFDQIRWTSSELARIAAYRYRLFLRMHDSTWYSRIRTLDLEKRSDVNKFWAELMPREQINRYGHSEHPLTYMMRHTQLIPRQLFSILQRVILSSQQRTGGYRMMTEDSIRDSIESLEPIVAGEIFQGFKHVYPNAERLGRAIFGNCETAFSYDHLEDRWRKLGRPMMRGVDSLFDLVEFTEMLLRMGILGQVERITDRYVEAKFAYHMLMPFTIGAGVRLAVHPIFSRYFSCAPNSYGKAILPQGAELELID